MRGSEEPKRPNCFYLSLCCSEGLAKFGSTPDRSGTETAAGTAAVLRCHAFDEVRDLHATLELLAGFDGWFGVLMCPVTMALGNELIKHLMSRTNEFCGTATTK